jgi:hypothetical protein
MLKYFKNNRKSILWFFRVYIVPLLLFELKSQYDFQNDSLNFEDKLSLSNIYF